MMWLDVRLNLDLVVIAQCEVEYRITVTEEKPQGILHTYHTYVPCKELIAVPTPIYRMYCDDLLKSHFFCGRH